MKIETNTAKLILTKDECIILEENLFGIGVHEGHNGKAKEVPKLEELRKMLGKMAHTGRSE